MGGALSYTPDTVAHSHPQHSGTERQHVANDYAKRLHIGSTQCHTLIQDVIGGLISSKSSDAPPKMAYCEYLNVSICPAVENETSVR